MRIRKLLIAVVATAILLSITACGGSSSSQSTSSAGTSVSKESTQAVTEETNVPSTSTDKTYKIGESVKSGDFVFTVNGVREPNPADVTVEPLEGDKYYLIEVTIENKGQKSETIESSVMFTLSDTQESVYIEGDGPSIGAKGKLAASLAPGEKTRAEIPYIISTTSKDLRLSVSHNLFTEDKFNFVLDR